MKRVILFIIVGIFFINGLLNAQKYDEVITEGEDKSKIEIIPVVKDENSEKESLKLNVEKIKEEKTQIKKDVEVNVEVKKLENVKSAQIEKKPLFKHKRDKNKLYIILILVIFAIAAS